jgi:hypothetical protein
MYIDPDDVRDRPPASPKRQHRGLNIARCVFNTFMMIVAMKFFTHVTWRHQADQEDNDALTRQSNFDMCVDSTIVFSRSSQN